MNQMNKILMLHRFTPKGDDKGFVAMSVDVGRCAAKPMHILILMGFSIDKVLIVSG